MIGPAVYESPRATYVAGGGGGRVGKQAAANSPSVTTTASRRPVTKPSPDDRTPHLYHPQRVTASCASGSSGPHEESRSYRVRQPGRLRTSGTGQSPASTRRVARRRWPSLPPRLVRRATPCP